MIAICLHKNTRKNNTILVCQKNKKKIKAFNKSKHYMLMNYYKKAFMQLYHQILLHATLFEF